MLVKRALTYDVMSCCVGVFLYFRAVTEASTSHVRTCSIRSLMIPECL